MTKLPKRAFEKAAKELPDNEQDMIAQQLLNLLESDERRWDEAFAHSGEKLDQLAQRARDHLRAGRVKPFNPEEL
jgi:hypothetical protein